MCIFCKIVKKEIPNYTVYEDDKYLAFLDISQATIGHTLVIPKNHFDSILDIDEKTSSEVFTLVTKITKSLSKNLNISNFNILNNCGETAGQSVRHFHIHIIPRYSEDDVTIKFNSNQLKTDEFINLINIIKKDI